MLRGHHFGPTHRANLNSPPLSPHLPGPSHNGFLDVFKHARLLTALGPYTCFFFFLGPLPASEWPAPSYPSDLSSNISSSGRPFLTIVSKVTPSHSYYLLIYQPVNLLHSIYHALKLSCLFICLPVYYIISLLLLSTKLLREGAGFTLLYQGAHTRNSNILKERVKN